MTIPPWNRRFEASCRDWQVRLGLMDWTLTFRVEPPSGNYEATICYDCASRQATLTSFGAGTPGRTKADRIALHEMLHLLFADTLVMAATRASDMHPDVGREEHRVIERLLNALEGRP